MAIVFQEHHFLPLQKFYLYQHHLVGYKPVDNLNTRIHDEYNVLLIGYPMHDEYMDLINQDKVIYLGFLDWLNHLYDYIDLAVLTDDGVMIEEVLACDVPIVTITKIKWGRYHNIAGIFEGAIMESSMEDANETILSAFENYGSIKDNADSYAEKLLDAKSSLAQKIIDVCGK